MMYVVCCIVFIMCDLFFLHTMCQDGYIFIIIFFLFIDYIFLHWTTLGCAECLWRHLWYVVHDYADD